MAAEGPMLDRSCSENSPGASSTDMAIVIKESAMCNTSRIGPAGVSYFALMGIEPLF